MYNFEIDNILRENNYNIPSHVYEIILSSPQIDHVKYSPYGDYFEIWTNDGCYWKFKIFLEDKDYE